MKEMKFYGATDMGKLRTNNEDAFVAQHIWTNRYVLCIAIDGVGGYEGGEVAAQIAQESITKHLAELLPDNPLEALKEASVSETLPDPIAQVLRGRLYLIVSDEEAQA